MSAVELVDLSRLQKACLDMEWERHTQYMGEIFFYGQQRLDKRMEAHRKKDDLIPKEVNTKLLPDRITKYLLEMAAAMPEELVVLVEIAPQQSRSLHQSREQYERHLGLLDDLLSDTLLNSLKYPSEVAFRIGKVQECPASLQDEWARLRRRAAPAVAFDDFRQHAVRMALLTNPKPDPGTRFAADNQLASNQSWKGSAIGRCPEKAAPPLRHGAFEVYLVVQRAGNLRPRVELLFSKLFSRCWPRANAVLGRLRKALDAELRLREDENVLARVRESNEPAELRAALQELSGAAGKIATSKQAAGEIAALQSQLAAKRAERFELEAEARMETEPEEVRKGEFKKKAALRRSMMSESERDLFAAAAAATNDPVGAALPAPWVLSAIPAAAIVDSMMEEDAEVKAEMGAGGSAEHSPGETQIATSKQAAGETLAPPPGRPRYTRLT
ncbi:hypothetical protein Ctob_010438 [Chrysochromulina tobinii]|uniref:Uncharacterized protein n=1 Tax=Chrysochromulina tobinii TaxID=1460289 RepID=A0A0M0JS33_9EUKA|nr:hypothetical protein Ctob_010438 [Chrysochromulina tobinii]|eukprot:KOO29315.1 hypothetical protein Ctob_010438 [Chrysochromulina sp. CCMP291]